MVSLGGGATLKLLTLNLIPMYPFSLLDPENRIWVFIWKSIRFFFFWFYKFPIPVLLIDSHMGENLKTGFQPSFHPKWEQTVLNVRTKSPSENHPTVCLT